MIQRAITVAVAAAALLLIVAFSAQAQPAPSPTMRAHFIDVGQGAATLLEFPCGAVLIDTGSEESGWFSNKFSGSEKLLAYLDAFFTRRSDLNRTLDLLLLTHPHLDHTRTVPQLIGAGGFTLRGVVTDGQTTGSGSTQQVELMDFAKQRQIPQRKIVYGTVGEVVAQSDSVIDPLDCGAVDPKLTVLWGQIGTDPGWGMDGQELAFDDENNHSVVLRVDFGAASFLITGDLEIPAIKSLLSRHGNTGLLDTDVYQVGHHGSANGTTQALLDAISPKAAVFAAGPDCRKGKNTAYAYGHPRKLVVRKVAAAVPLKRPLPANVKVATAVRTFEPFNLTQRVYSTGWDGTVVISARADGWLEFETLGQGGCP